MKRASLIAAIAVSAIAVHAPPSMAAEGAWAAGEKVQVRLIAAGFDAAGNLDAGIEIVLPEGWHTYWRAPGEAGIAPSFDFSGSANAGVPEVSFPVPVRLDDGVSVTNVYKGSVLLPVSVPVTDPASPVDLSVALAIGVCSDICIPAEATATLVVPPGESDAVVAARLADIRAALPGPAEPGVFAVDEAVREGGSDRKPVFRLTATVPVPAEAELFIEGPADWAPYAPVRVAGDGEPVWTVKFSRRGAETPINGAQLRATLTSGGRAVEQVVTVD